MKKLAEMNAIELSDVLCRIAEPVGRLVSSPDVHETLLQIGERLKDVQGGMISYFGTAVSMVAPAFMAESHRDDVFAIVAGIKGITLDEVRNQNGAQTLGEVVSMILGDGGLMTIFRSMSQV